MAKEFIVYSATRASFEALVASGEVDNTQIGIIAESGEFWENGNYHPLVMLSDYLKKTDAVALAKDLTGSIEATPEEFTFRTSAGTKSIRDESAVIRRIKGNTSVWGQLLGEMNADNWSQYSATYTNVEYLENECKLTILSAYTGGNVYQLGLRYKPTVTHYVSGHKYMVIFDAHVEVSGRMAIEADGSTYYGPRIEAGQWNTTFITFTRNGTVNSFYFKPPFEYQTTASVGKTYSVRNAMLFDLTALYEVGNEPTTLEEFKKLYPESYYPYCAPEVRSMRATGIETIGANAFDKDSVVGGLINADGTVTSNDIYSVARIEVVPNEVYTLSNVANAANTTYTYAIYDSEDRFISVGEIKNSVTKPVSVSGDVTMPISARYMRVVVHNDYLDSCCVNLKHSGTLTAEEATYFKEVRMLPDIAKYFPDGMQGIGDEYDEINEENAIKRFGVVDLGTLEWRYDATYNTFYTPERIFAHMGKAKCAMYEQNNVHPPQMLDKQIALRDYYWRNSAAIKDSDYTDSTSFKAAMSGVILVYELIEPIVTPITEPLQLDYKVADFGTEKMLSNLPSSPFRADIVYQFNAADRIRDNARNIERLEEHTKDMATMEDVFAAIPTEVATATQRRVVAADDLLIQLTPNILYDWSMETIEHLTLPELGMSDSAYDNVWMARCALLSNDALYIPYSVSWKDGVAPTFTSWAILDLMFRKTPADTIIGEWKIYR